ncbi:hypothetical protein [Anaerocellum danielii]|uniref:Uncharacterized protein n=1 Tax=Anaerocellum danielii TaxID=1387557 RepID=A0ABZ0U3K2_9FIRM|nr:hypothetical protein [Caldicellulosiruptor danielii]WPX09318.1 hypothetical protein SOJ16_000517 [Caldicellulosiruptor danielii]
MSAKSFTIKILRISIWLIGIILTILGIYLFIISKSAFILEIFLIVGVSGILFIEIAIKNFSQHIPLKLKIWNIAKLSLIVLFIVTISVFTNSASINSMLELLLIISMIAMLTAVIFITERKLKKKLQKI